MSVKLSHETAVGKISNKITPKSEELTRMFLHIKLKDKGNDFPNIALEHVSDFFNFDRRS